MNGEGLNQDPSPGPSQGLNEDPSQGVSPLLQVYLKLKLGKLTFYYYTDILLWFMASVASPYSLGRQ